MTKHPKIFLAAALAIAIGATAASAVTDSTNKATVSAKISELFGDPAVAKGEGVEVKRSELDNELVNIKANIARSGRNVTPDQMLLMERQTLDGLITFHLAVNKATAAEKARAKENFEKALAKFKADRKMTDEEFNEQQARELRILGASRETWEKQNIDQQTLRLVLERELNVTCTDADVKKYYDEHPSMFEEGESVRVCHILFATVDPATRQELAEEKKQAKRKQADEIRKRVVAGEDFTKLAKEFSEDPGVKENNGEYKFKRDDPFVEEFKAASFAMSTNQVSEIVTTQFGYHIIKLLEKNPARQIPLTEVTDWIKDRIKAEQLQKKLPDYFEKIMKEAKVEILDERLKAVNPNGEFKEAGKASEKSDKK